MNYLLNNVTGKASNLKTSFKLERKEQKLIFKFEAFDSYLFSYSNEDNSDLWRGCVCEVFLDLGDEFYYEFEVAPNGAVFVAKIKDRKITFFKQDFFKASVRFENNNYFVNMVIDLTKLNNPKHIRYNAFRVETLPNKKEQNLSALNPTLCETFHVREKFIPLDL